MKVSKVRGIYFSPTGTTERTVKKIVKDTAAVLGVPSEFFNFTTPKFREERLVFERDELIVFGVPVIAGRVPNVLLKFLALTEGSGALAVPIVLYGNRNYDDALIELRDILENAGAHTIAAGAFVGAHSFSDILAAGRPDKEDLEIMEGFSRDIAEKIKSEEDLRRKPPIAVKGTPHPYRGYYQPRDRKGSPVDIRKVKPLTNDNCIDCKVCVRVCPMGSIVYEDVSLYQGICIKCGACVKKCPFDAKYYDDPDYLYHKEELEEGFKRRGEIDLFL